LSSGRAPTTPARFTPPASPFWNTPVGLWRSSTGYPFPFVATAPGYDEFDESPAYKLRNGCAVTTGVVTRRYSRLGNDLYRLQNRLWTTGPGGAGRYGGNCTSAWSPPVTVKLLA